jgi:hypothetical protein
MEAVLFVESADHRHKVASQLEIMVIRVNLIASLNIVWKNRNIRFREILLDRISFEGAPEGQTICSLVDEG